MQPLDAREKLTSIETLRTEMEYSLRDAWNRKPFSGENPFASKPTFRTQDPLVEALKRKFPTLINIQVGTSYWHRYGTRHLSVKAESTEHEGEILINNIHT